ncbi:MAG TPA: citrate/2-methylcitrate synthase [Vicinamibacteria bacterium]|nr:citrate/2-methylcitrate synthase [Vicinamibacteria bacterium]
MDRAVQPTDLLSAVEAARRLEVKPETLYAYVSRGLVRSLPGSKKGRRLYVAEDVERLRARHVARAGHGAVAAGALRWGEPVLETALTEIDPAAGPRYRGLSAVGLAEEGVAFEAVAELLWTGELPSPLAPWPPPASEDLARRALALLPPNAPPLARLASVVPVLAGSDPARYAASDEADRTRGRRLIRTLAALLPPRLARPARASTCPGSVATTLSGSFGLKRRGAQRALDVTLVLSADHELNPSTFAVRVAAATGADLYACASAGLATLSGPRHGGACDRVEALVAETGRPERAEEVVRERSRRGESVPGFGHPLYPDGDPRARVLLDEARRLSPRPVAALKILLALVEAMRRAEREPPTLDAGLVAISSALGLPAGSAAGLFAVGRMAGWIAHALEQRSAGFLVRPRARYVGPEAWRAASKDRD